MYLGLGGVSRDASEEQKAGEDGSRAEYEGLTDKEKIVLDFHYYNYAFCKERRLDACATSTFLSIMKDLFDEVTLGAWCKCCRRENCPGFHVTRCCNGRTLRSAAKGITLPTGMAWQM